MDHTYQSTMLMPASYAVLSEEEMTYLDGGADYNFNVGKYTVTFHPEVLVTYAMNVVVNGVYMLSQGSFQYFINTFYNDYVLSIKNCFDSFWIFHFNWM